MSDKPTIFISYAREDDEMFVRRLYQDLMERGLEVWWDRKAMESRGRSFLQEIRDAIASADRLMLVVGEQAQKSEYVRAEWQFALAHCVVVMPLLRLGDHMLLPPELAKLHCLDFRSARPYEDALAELLRILGQSVPQLGALNGNVPALPPHFLPRPAD